MQPVPVWQTFYEIIGSAAGALTGLQFVVMALIADMPMRAGEGETANAFATPTVVHFVAALLLAASCAMPWPSFGLAQACWVAAGLIGFLYTVSVTLRMRKQTGYKPVLEDWCFHCAMPTVAYLGLAAAGMLLVRHNAGALFSMGAIMLLLLAIGIHNAWDNVTYLVILRRERLSMTNDPPA